MPKTGVTEAQNITKNHNIPGKNQSSQPSQSGTWMGSMGFIGETGLLTEDWINGPT